MTKPLITGPDLDSVEAQTQIRQSWRDQAESTQQDQIMSEPYLLLLISDLTTFAKDL